MIYAGAVGCVLKKDAGAELVKAVYAIVDGGGTISPQIAVHLAQRYRSDASG